MHDVPWWLEVEVGAVVMRARLMKRLPVIDWSALVVVLFVPSVITVLCAALGHALGVGDSQ